MAEILIAVPVLDRPRRARPLLESLAESTSREWELMFLVSPRDQAQLRACEQLATEDDRVRVEVVPWPPGHGDYARKINRACELSESPWVFQGADDICFCPAWAEHALRFAQTRVGVIGTNDLANPRVMKGRHSTHSLVRLSYVRDQGTIDEPGKMLHEGYGHQFCDDEMVQTAMRRRAFEFARFAEVPHQHPDWGTAQTDQTYQKGQASFWQDRALFERRQLLWTSREVGPIVQTVRAHAPSGFRPGRRS